MSRRVLETDFPITQGQYHPSTRSSILSSYSLQRQSTTTDRGSSAQTQPPSYSRSVSASNGMTAAPDWQYQPAMGVPVISGRSGSLKKAYSSAVGDDIDNKTNERDPLFPNKETQAQLSPQRSQISSTSDYNSEQIQSADEVERMIKTSTKINKKQSQRQRKQNEDSLSTGAYCCLIFLVIIAEILLIGIMFLVTYWILAYHSKEGAPFDWRNDLDLQFNLHPFLMVTGFIFFMGQAMLIHRICRCCRRIWNKLLHALFHILAIPCIAIGFIAVLDYHNLRELKDGTPNPIPNFYSMHSWMGLITMGLFALQFVVGFFSFLLLLCCESATASFRSSLVPIHSIFGVTTFVMAVATACTGFTERAFFTLSIAYSKWVPYLFDRFFNKETALSGLSNKGPEYTDEMFSESLTVNAMCAALVGLAILIPFIALYPSFKYRPKRTITVTHDRYA